MTTSGAEVFAGARKLLDELDTSVIGIDLDALDAQLAALRSAFPDTVRHAIAIKTMPHPKLLGYLSKAGFGLEAASIEEVLSLIHI